MPFNGSGSFSFTANTVQPAVTGTDIDSSDFNDSMDELETALSTCVTKDGQTTCTQRIPFTEGIYLDDSGDTYIYESASNVVRHVVGGGIAFQITTTVIALDDMDLVMTNKNLYLDNGGDTYIVEASANTVNHVVGGNTMVQLTDSKAKFVGITTTASAANAFLDSGDSNNLLRSTSSLKYKRDLEPVTLEEARRIVMGSEGFSYASAIETDNQDRRWLGFGAEDIHAVDPRLVHYANGEPDGVQYERYVVVHNVLLRDIERRLVALEAMNGLGRE